MQDIAEKVGISCSECFYDDTEWSEEPCGSCDNHSNFSDKNGVLLKHMKVLKFDMCFSIKVIDKSKRDTIRRDTTFMVGDPVHLVSIVPKAGGADYETLGIATITSILPVSIDCIQKVVFLNGILLEPEQTEELFKDNGWENINSGFEYYKSMYGKIFEGVNIKLD